MKRILKSFLAISLCFLLAFSVGTAAVAQESEKDYNYIIESPYDSIDWDTINQYKTSLHSHTMASDGGTTIEESVEMHYALGYDILAITDHAVCGVQWDQIPQMVPLYRLFKLDRTRMETPAVLTSERREAIISGEAEINTELLSKSMSQADLDYYQKDSVYDFSRAEGQGGMLEVTTGCEANGAVPMSTHINTFWSTYGQARPGIYGDYDYVAKMCHEEGGISFIDHAGDGFTESTNDPEKATNKYFVNKFSNIFLKYDSCVAYDINSGWNQGTEYDVITWDEILKKTVPKGRNVSNITFTDGHLIEQYDRAFSMMCMKEKTVEELRSCLEKGAWFSIARYARLYDGIAEELGYYMDSHGWFCGEGKVEPRVTYISVDDDEDTISFGCNNGDYVQWISGGEVLKEGLIADSRSLTTIDLDDYNEYLTKYGYVRFQVMGEGGMLYSQAIVAKAEGVEYSSTVYETIDFSTIFRSFMQIVELVLGRTWPAVILKKLLLGTVY